MLLLIQVIHSLFFKEIAIKNDDKIFVLSKARKEVRYAVKQKKFIVTIDYQGEEDIFSGDLILLLMQYKNFNHLKEIYGDIQNFDVEELDNQGV